MIEWRVIEGFPRYQVSSAGQVRGPRGLLKLETLKDGYPCVSLYNDGRKKFTYVHKLVADTFLPGEGQVLHLNDLKNDNRVENLVRGTHQENMAHKSCPPWRRM